MSNITFLLCMLCWYVYRISDGYWFHRIMLVNVTLLFSLLHYDFDWVSLIDIKLLTCRTSIPFKAPFCFYLEPNVWLSLQYASLVSSSVFLKLPVNHSVILFCFDPLFSRQAVISIGIDYLFIFFISWSMPNTLIFLCDFAYYAPFFLLDYWINECYIDFLFLSCEHFPSGIILNFDIYTDAHL